MKKLFSLVMMLTVFSMGIAQMIDPIHWTTSCQQEDNTLKVVFSAKIDEGYHLYALDAPADGPQPTEFHFESMKGLAIKGKPQLVDGDVHSQYDENFEMNLSFYETKASFSQEFEMTGDAWQLEGYVYYMSCNDAMCTPPTRFEFCEKGASAASAQAQGTSASSAEVADQNSADGAEPSEATNMTRVGGGISWTPVIDELQAFGDAEGEYSDKNHSLLYILIAGFIAGLLAVITPCVWPMIPMTVSFFLKRAKDRKQSVRDACIYGVSIIVIYLLLGLVVTAIFGASALNSLATNAVFNVFFFILLVIFALSFLGAFEIALPSSWTTKLDEKADTTTGLISIFFMAFTLCLVSFSCTGPIIGTLLVETATSGSMLYPAIGMFSFAFAMSLPFTLFALFPSWLQAMPKSGGWMNMVKVVLGFCELALSLKFLSVADLAYGWGILDRETFLCLWIVIFFCVGLYLLGFIRLPHDDDPQPSDRVSIFRLLLAIVCFSFSIYMIPGLWGAPCRAISAFAPTMTTQDFKLGREQDMNTYYDYEEGMAAAKRLNKPVLLDFSGYGCVNCRKMEAAVWTDPEVKQLIESEYVLIELMVDDKTALPEIEIVTENGKQVKLRTVGDKWSYLQRYKFGANAQPFHVLLNPSGMPLTGSYSYSEDVDEYVDFLNRGIERMK